MSTRTCNLKFTAQLKEEVSISRAHFTLCTTRTKRIEHLGKNPRNYVNNHAETGFFEQKPIKVDDFNEAEEKEDKERVEKRKMKRREVAEKNKLLKKKRKRKRKMNRMKKKCGVG